MESQETKNEQLLSYWKKFAGKIATGEKGCPTTFDAFKAGWEACVGLYDGETEAKFAESRFASELFREEKPSWQASPADIYAAYPKKVGRSAAIKAIEKALKTRSESYLLDSVKAYALAVSKWPHTEYSFIPHPATWFNQGRYDDDRSTWVRDSRTANKPQMRLHESQIKCS